jgi:ATP-dependent Clp protease ATP-binding subunit ClpX
LIRFGLIPELIGRIPVIAPLAPLDEDALLTILTKPRNALTKQYAKLLEMDNVELVFLEETLREVARLAIAQGTGARGLRTIMESSMLNLMFDIPSLEGVYRVEITPEVITEATAPKFYYKDQQLSVGIDA